MNREIHKDEHIKKRVEDYMYWNDQINESRLIVRVLDSEVRLTGTVSSEDTRTTLEKKIADMPDVQYVHNQLTVWKGGDRKSHTDEELREQIKKTLKLRQGFKIEDADIDVHVEQGRVTLTGVVDAEEKKQRLEDVTRNVIGVLDVENVIRVDPAHSSLSGTFL